MSACNNQEAGYHQKEMTQHHMQLNQGKKWQLDSASRKNIGRMDQAVQDAQLQKQISYTSLATTLQNASDTLIQQCRMQGPGHDMLHVWLENFLDNVKMMKTGNPDQQAEAFKKVQADLKEAPQYFE